MRFPSCLRRHVISCALSLVLAAFPSSANMGAGATDSPFPAPGTYTLQRINKAPSGWVIEDSVWTPRRLSSYTTGSITLFSFFYGTCRDPEGCPVAWTVFDAVHEAIEKDPALHGRVRLVFLSLNPSVDTPELLSAFRTKGTPASPWVFLTTWSVYFLKPILTGMGLTISYAEDENGRPTGEVLHMLKVYLIDATGWVREIYTTNYLNPDVVMNDIRTLVIEEDRSKTKS